VSSRVVRRASDAFRTTRTVAVVATAALLVTLAGCRSRDANVGTEHAKGAASPAAESPRPAAPAARASFVAPAFPLRLSAERSHLEDRQGKPVLLHGEAAWSMFVELELGEAEAYLDDRRARGFNAVIVNLVEHKFSRDAPRNAYGEEPFLRAGDFSAPNPAYFQRVEGFLEAARKRELVVLLCPAYLGYDGGEEGWYRDLRANGPGKLLEYGKYVGQRYTKFDNIVWLQGGDFTPPPNDLALVDAVARGIRSVRTDWLHAVHLSPETSGAEVVHSDWLDLDTTYTYRPVYLKSLADALRNDGRPHFLLESKYEGEHDSTPASLRAQAYQALLTGAVGHFFGHRDIWPFKAGWRRALESPGSVSMQHVRPLFEPRAWWRLQPDREHRLLIDGAGRYGETDYAVLAFTDDARLAIAYVPTPRAIKLDLEKLAHPLRARWYDPTNGAFSGDTRLVDGPRVREFTPPAKNAAGDADWVLVLETESVKSSAERR
jgi:hypothetical protein